MIHKYIIKSIKSARVAYCHKSLVIKVNKHRL